VNYAKTDEPDQDAIGLLTRVDQRNHVLDWGQDWTNPFAAARGR